MNVNEFEKNEKCEVCLILSIYLIIQLRQMRTENKQRASHICSLTSSAHHLTHRRRRLFVLSIHKIDSIHRNACLHSISGESSRRYLCRFSFSHSSSHWIDSIHLTTIFCWDICFAWFLYHRLLQDAYTMYQNIQQVIVLDCVFLCVAVVVIVMVFSL
jgi:hypothetical protein